MYIHALKYPQKFSGSPINVYGISFTILCMVEVCDCAQNQEEKKLTWYVHIWTSFPFQAFNIFYTQFLKRLRYRYRSGKIYMVFT